MEEKDQAKSLGRQKAEEPVRQLRKEESERGREVQWPEADLDKAEAGQRCRGRGCPWRDL